VSESVSRADTAVEFFLQGYNCSQAVLAAFAPDFGLSREHAFKLGGPFGGGMARCGDACGAVTGAMMVLGLAYSSAEVDPEAKACSYAAARRLFDEFRASHGSIVCRDLLGCDLGTEEGWEEAKARDTHHTVCPGLVRRAAEVVEQILGE
jgi:C_GCAxxG_C_C family probable redox protein